MPIKATLATSPGCRAASVSATLPPIEWPAMWTGAAFLGSNGSDGIGS